MNDPHLSPENRALLAERHAIWRRHIDKLVGELLMLDRFALNEVCARVAQGIRDRAPQDFRA